MWEHEYVIWRMCARVYAKPEKETFIGNSFCLFEFKYKLKFIVSFDLLIKPPLHIYTHTHFYYQNTCINTNILIYHWYTCIYILTHISLYISGFKGSLRTWILSGLFGFYLVTCRYRGLIVWRVWSGYFENIFQNYVMILSNPKPIAWIYINLF